MAEILNDGEFRAEIGVDFSQFSLKVIEVWLGRHRPKNDTWPTERERNLWQTVAGYWGKYKEMEKTGKSFKSATLQAGPAPETFIIDYEFVDQEKSVEKDGPTDLEVGSDLAIFTRDQLEKWLMSSYSEERFSQQADFRGIWQAVMRYCEKARLGGEEPESAKLVKRKSGVVDFEWVPKEIIIKKFL